MAKLVINSGELGGREFPIEGETIIGRGNTCDVLIPQPWISRQHARVIAARGRYFIEDMGTPNGTTVNGRRITRSELRDGDTISLGECALTFTLRDVGGAAASEVQADEINATVISTLDPRKALSPDTNLPDSVQIKRLKTRLQTLQEVSEAACGALEIDGLVKRILEHLLRVFPQAAHAHAVLLGLDEGGGDVHLSVAQSGEALTEVKLSNTLLETATRERKAVLASDAMSDSRFAAATSITGQSLRSIMCSPLVVGDKVLGAMQIDTTSLARPFTVDDLQLLATISGQAAVAAESARLHRELAARQRLAAVGETISGLAHCIKNILNGLRGGAYVLDVGIRKQDREKIAKGWEMVKRNTDFVFTLVKDMLAYCRKEALHREPTALGALLSEMLLMVQEAAARSGVETSLSLQDELPEIEIDATAVKRAVLNLLTNSVEACPNGCRVMVSAEVDGRPKRLVIAVEDTGPGIPTRIRERLFEPFFTTKGSSGTGLGLPFVKKVAEEHGGHVEVESEPGRGTTFRISLPLGGGEKSTSLIE